MELLDGWPGYQCKDRVVPNRQSENAPSQSVALPVSLIRVRKQLTGVNLADVAIHTILVSVPLVYCALAVSMIELLGQEPSKIVEAQPWNMALCANQHQHPSIVKATGQRVAALSRVAGAPRPIPTSCNNTLQAVVLPVHHPRLQKHAMLQPVPSTVRGIGPTVAVLLRVAVALR